MQTTGGINDHDVAAARLGLLGDGILFLGPVAEPDLPILYSAAELFIFPSLYEGFGLPVIEAMACGTAVVCAAGSSLPEVASDAALLVDPESLDAIAEALLALSNDDARCADLRARGLQRATAYTWAHTAQATLDTYRRAAG